MQKLKIVDFCTFPENLIIQLFKDHMDYQRFERVRVEKDSSMEEKCELVRDADILLSDPAHMNPIPRQIIEAAKNLRLIQCYTIGFDDIDIKYARGRGIPVANSAGILSKPIAEYTIMAAMYLSKSIEYARSELIKGNWVHMELMSGPKMPLEFGSLTLGIIGCGSIGQEVARVAGIFGTRILYYNRSKLDESIENSLGLEYYPLEDVLRFSDVVSVNVPLTDETRGMIGVDEIGLMKKGAILINTARGEVVDVHALANAVKSGHLRGAAVDVFENEPSIQDCPLIGLENVILTPHCSAISPMSLVRCPPKVMENLNKIYVGERPVRVVN